MTSNEDNFLSSFNYDALCKTEVTESDKFTFVWSISRFSSRVKETASGQFLKSKGFQILGPGSKVTNFHVKLFPIGEVPSVKDDFSLSLCTEDTEDAVITNCSFMAVSPNGNKRKLEYEMGKVPPKTGFGYARFFKKRNELAKYIHNDTLTLVLEITVIEEKESVELVVSRKTNEALSENYHKNQLSQDLHHLYRTKEFADITIKCGGKSYECHKNILASRSPVFQAMFKSDMKEKKTGSVAIKNMTPKVLESFLRYIYTGHDSCIETLAKELLASADLYQIGGLKELCELELCSSMEVGNCIDLLVLGDMYQALTLKTRALDYVRKNMDRIDISECKKTLISYPTLLFEVMELLIPKRKTNDFDNSGSDGRKRTRTK